MWNKISDGNPRKAGNYLCTTNDNRVMVCYLNVLGYFTLAEVNRYYGDLYGTDYNEEHSCKGREVIKWMEIPEDE